MGIFEGIKNHRENKAVKNMGPEEPSFDAKKMTNTKFIEFMQQAYGDVADKDPVRDSKELEDRFAAFESKDKVIAGLDKIYSKEFTGLIEVDEDSRKDEIEKYVMEEIKNNPERLPELLFRVEKFTESEKELDKNQRELARLERYGDAETLKNKADILAKAKAAKGRFGMFTKRPDLALKQVTEELKIPLADIDRELAKTTQMLKNIGTSKESLNKVQDKFKDVRSEILSNLEIVQALNKLGKDALKTKYKDVVTDVNTKPLNELEELFNKFSEIKNSGSRGDKLLENAADVTEYEDAVKALQEGMEKKLEEEVAFVLTHSGLGDLEKRLTPFLKKGGMGGKSKDEIRTKLATELREVVEDPSSPLEPEKKFLIKSLIAQHKLE